MSRAHEIVVVITFYEGDDYHRLVQSRDRPESRLQTKRPKLHADTAAQERFVPVRVTMTIVLVAPMGGSQPRDHRGSNSACGPSHRQQIPDGVVLVRSDIPLPVDHLRQTAQVVVEVCRLIDDPPKRLVRSLKVQKAPCRRCHQLSGLRGTQRHSMPARSYAQPLAQANADHHEGHSISVPTSVTMYCW